MNVNLDLKFEYNIPMKLEKIPLNKFLSHLTNISPLEYLIELLPKCTENGPWIAGGSLHRTYRKLPLTNADVDVFFKNKEQFEKFVTAISLTSLFSGNTIESTIYSEWHCTLTIKYMDVDWKIQCVTFKYFDNIEELFKSFDINVCRIAYDGTNVVYEDGILNQINNNKLKFNEGSIYYPSVTLKRLVKYVKMGYDIEDIDLKLLTHAFYKSKKKAIDILDQDLLTKKPIETYEGLK
ncbi:MAG: hypothetical protein EB127_20565 [Alphaproteobacteria bacterium]|nr:hypothetical protein [Alphaproteobacteria bacterium]